LLVKQEIASPPKNKIGGSQRHNTGLFEFSDRFLV